MQNNLQTLNSILNPQQVQPLPYSPIGAGNTVPVTQPNQPMGTDWGALNTWLGGTDAQGNQGLGLIPTSLQAIGGLLQGWSGMQQVGIAKDSLAFRKKAWQQNYDNQVKTTNTRLEDRQRARVARNPDQAQPVDQYMAANKVG